MFNQEQSQQVSQALELDTTVLDHKPLAYSPQQFAIITGISLSSITRDRHNGCLGGIPFKKVGGRVLYPAAAIQQWLQDELKQGKHEFLPAVNPLRKRARGRPKGTTKSELAKRNNSNYPPPIKEARKRSADFIGGVND